MDIIHVTFVLPNSDRIVMGLDPLTTVGLVRRLAGNLLREYEFIRGADPFRMFLQVDGQLVLLMDDNRLVNHFGRRVVVKLQLPLVDMRRRAIRRASI